MNRPLNEICGDCPGAMDDAHQLLPLVYDELRRLALIHLESERPDHTLQPTALVHEVYLRFAGQRSFGWHNRDQFFASAATTMRRILVDYARKRKADKRGGGRIPSVLDESAAVLLERDFNIEALGDALDRLATVDPRKSQVVELRMFAGLTVEEISSVLGIGARTVKREWAVAKAWLYSELKES